MQVAIQIRPQHAIIGRAVADAAGVGKGVAEVEAADSKAHVGQRLAHMRDVDGCDNIG